MVGNADSFDAMLDRKELIDSSETIEELLLELEVLKQKLRAARARNITWRALIERHLEKGCPSQSLRALLFEADPQAGEDLG